MLPLYSAFAVINESTDGLPAVTKPFAPLASPFPTTAVVASPENRDHVIDAALVTVEYPVVEHEGTEERPDQYRAFNWIVPPGESDVEAGQTISRGVEQFCVPFPQYVPQFVS